jgi:hypothetical protein
VNDANPPSIMLGVQPGGIGSLDDADAVVMGELTAETEWIPEEAVMVAMKLPVVDNTLVELVVDISSVEETRIVVAELIVKVDDTELESVIRSVDEAILEVEVETNKEEPELVIAADDAVLESLLEDATSGEELELEIGTDDDPVSRLTVGVDDGMIGEIELEPAEDIMEVPSELAGIGIELEVMEVSGVIAKLPMESPASS